MTLSALIGQVFLGWLAADVMSGCFHWWQDNLIEPDTPIVGPYLAAHAHLHHRLPLEFLEGSFLYRNGPTYVAAAIVFALGAVVSGLSPFIVSLSTGVAMTTQVHYWAHQPRKAPALVRVLQDTGFLQSPKQHSRHHSPPFRSAPCVLTDFINPLLRALLN